MICHWHIYWHINTDDISLALLLFVVSSASILHSSHKVRPVQYFFRWASVAKWNFSELLPVRCWRCSRGRWIKNPNYFANGRIGKSGNNLIPNHGFHCAWCTENIRVKHKQAVTCITLALRASKKRICIDNRWNGIVQFLFDGDFMTTSGADILGRTGSPNNFPPTPWEAFTGAL